jgi:hypothetical protein
MDSQSVGGTAESVLGTVGNVRIRIIHKCKLKHSSGMPIFIED